MMGLGVEPTSECAFYDHPPTFRRRADSENFSTKRLRYKLLVSPGIEPETTSAECDPLPAAPPRQSTDIKKLEDKSRMS